MLRLSKFKNSRQAFGHSYLFFFNMSMHFELHKPYHWSHSHVRPFYFVVITNNNKTTCVWWTRHCVSSTCTNPSRLRAVCSTSLDHSRTTRTATHHGSSSADIDSVRRRRRRHPSTGLWAKQRGMWYVLITYMYFECHKSRILFL